MTAVQHEAMFGRALEVHRLIPGSVYTVEGCITLCKVCHGPKPKRARLSRDFALLTPKVICQFPAELLSLIDAEADDVGRTRTAEIVRALTAFYASKGKWPPSSSAAK
jgi:hypothetical protein